MNKVIAYTVIFISVLTLLGGDPSGAVHLLGLLFLLIGAIHLLIRRQLPSGFWTNLVLLVFGPLVLLCIITAILNGINKAGMVFDWFPILLLPVLIAFLCYGWYCWQSRKRKAGGQFQIRGSEREFIFPFVSHSTRLDEQDQEEER